jgi:hypothetical protein
LSAFLLRKQRLLIRKDEIIDSFLKCLSKKWFGTEREDGREVGIPRLMSVQEGTQHTQHVATQRQTCEPGHSTPT